jgi:hypothetical protein
MAEAFFLHWKVSQPFVLHNKPESIHTLLTVEPNPAILGNLGAGSSLPAHVIVLVDVSASMDYLVRFDPDAKLGAKILTEGQASRGVESNVPTRRQAACDVVTRLAESLGDDDCLTLVAFDDQAHVLANAVPGRSRGPLRAAVQRLAEVGGGGTSLGRGLQAVRKYLHSGNKSAQTRKVIVLSDGEDQEAALALSEAKQLGQIHGVPIVAFGTGECKVAFLTELAKSSLGGSFNHIRDEVDAGQLFAKVLSGQKNVQATGVVLRLWLSPEVHVSELYRTRPEILYVGDPQPDASNQVELRLEQMEKGKAYEFLFRCALPGRPAGQRLRLGKASLEYDLPALQRLREQSETNIVVEYTADEQRTRQRNGDVRRALTRAEVQRQVLYLQGKVDLLRQGRGSLADRTEVANLLKVLIQKFEEFGDLATANQYRQMQEEFRAGGTISQEMLNRSLAASSVAEEIVVAQDIDF